MKKLDEFRRDFETWLDENAPRSLYGKAHDPKYAYWGGRQARFASSDAERWTAQMMERGFTVPDWPEEFGGAGLTREHRTIIRQALSERELPIPLMGFGIEMLGPTLFQFGPEALKKEHLPKIARGEIRWCQGYSEPNAGSDLASLQTSAVRDGDTFIINGQKIWTSYGDLSDWIFLLVRTDPNVKKQAGITFLLVDLDDPGVEIRPIHLISGASPFTETFFTDVRVPASNVVGDINTGWTVAKALLGFERNMIAALFGRGHESDGTGPAILEFAKKHVAYSSGRLADPILRDRITQQWMDLTCFEATVQRGIDARKAGHQPGSEASMLKYYGSELNKRREELFQSIMGPEALGWEGQGYDPDTLTRSRRWLRSRGNSIEGGTSEIQLNIIARHVLGLP